MRDNFPATIKDLLAKRVGYRCSNPSCRQPTSGPHNDITKTVNVGVAAHITAAAIGGPRYDASLSVEERKSGNNGIWLCQKCAKLIDSDLARYSFGVLRDWKRLAEEIAIYELESDAIAQKDNFTKSSDNFFNNNERIEAYKSLYDEITRASNIITLLFKTDELSVEEKQAISYEVGLKVAKLTDHYKFYFSHEIVVQTVGAFVDVGDIFAMDDPKVREEEFHKFYKYIRIAYRMIESVRDTGKLDPSITSPLLEHFKYRKAIQDKEDQKF